MIKKASGFTHLLQWRVSSKFSNEKPISYYYKVLGVKPGFKPDQLKYAYLEMVKKYHPDLSKEPNAAEKFREIQQAYDILQDPSKRFTEQQIDNDANSERANEFKTKFRDEFKKKKQDQDQPMDFSYNLFKKHHEKYEEKKKNYTKYYGTDREFYARNDEPVQPPWKSIGVSVAMLGITASAYWMVHAS